jgi:predicted nucleic acid-binding protein
VIVVDTNLIAYFWINGDRTPIAQAVMERDPAWCAPVLWRSEMRNILAGYLRRKSMAAAHAREVMADAERFLAAAEFDVPSSLVFDLVESSACSAYDCEFVALARYLGVRLVTADRDVLRAFPDNAMSPEAFSR